MLFAFVGTAIASLGGIFFTYLWDETSSLVKRVILGIVVGTAAWGLIGFTLATLVKDMTLPIVIGSLIVTLFLPLVFGYKSILKRDLGNPTVCLSTIGYYIILAFVLAFILRTGFREMDGAYFTSYVDNYSDSTLHTGIITGFTEGKNYPPEHPDFAGTRLTYPLLFDFTTAMLVKLGVPLATAYYFQHLLFLLVIVYLLDHFAYMFSGNRVVGYLTPILVLLSGGLGFVVFFKELINFRGSLGEFLMQLPHEYTIYGDNLKWGSAIVNWFIPMRSLLLGVPLVLIIVSWWWQRIQANKTNFKLMWGAGFVTALLPLAHGHSYIVVLLLAGLLSLMFLNKKDWVRFYLPAIILALPQVYAVSMDSQTSITTFFGWLPGWMKGSTNFFWFWILNLGAFLPLLIIGLIKPGVMGKSQKLFYLPILSLFILPNIFRLAPWEWDNTKIFLYFCIFSAPIVAMTLVNIWNWSKKGQVFAGALFVVLTLSGLLDVFHVAVASNNWVIWDRDALEMGTLIQQNTPPRSIILVAPHINHPVLLSGRQAFMGYSGRLWTHGLSYYDREQEVKRMYTEGKGARDLFARSGINYILLGDGERHWAEEQNLLLNENFITSLPMIAQTANKKLYQVTFE